MGERKEDGGMGRDGKGKERKRRERDWMEWIGCNSPGLP